jgi:Na+-transporting methylmalonyl-CoA/oxaloacetate decarboxylase gamma subunit
MIIKHSIEQAPAMMEIVGWGGMVVGMLVLLVMLVLVVLVREVGLASPFVGKVGGGQEAEEEDGEEEKKDINRDVVVLGRIKSFHDRQQTSPK